jgi:hypothetical protein
MMVLSALLPAEAVAEEPKHLQQWLQLHCV